MFFTCCSMAWNWAQVGQAEIKTNFINSIRSHWSLKDFYCVVCVFINTFSSLYWFLLIFLLCMHGFHKLKYPLEKVKTEIHIFSLLNSFFVFDVKHLSELIFIQLVKLYILIVQNNACLLVQVSIEKLF